MTTTTTTAVADALEAFHTAQQFKAEGNWDASMAAEDWYAASLQRMARETGYHYCTCRTAIEYGKGPDGLLAVLAAAQDGAGEARRQAA